MSITAENVKVLRERTGAGMLDCKKALTETNGDFEKAIEFLRKKGMAAAAKKVGRATKEGTIQITLSPNQKTGVMVEVNCETDFVARTEQFKDFVSEISAHVEKANPAPNALLTQSFFKNPEKTVEQVLSEAIARLGENMGINRYTRWAVNGNGILANYIHGEGKMGVMIELALGNAALESNEALRIIAKDLCMHIAAANPKFTSPEDVPADVVAKEKEIALAQMVSQNKPAAVLEKIAEGKVKKYFEETCFVKQAFVKDSGKTIEQLLADSSKALGGSISVVRFARWQLGEDQKDVSAEA